VLSIPLGRTRQTMHMKRGTFPSYIVTAKEIEEVLDFEICGLPYRTRSIQPLVQAIDYIYSPLLTENRSQAESQSKTGNAQMLVPNILSVP